MTKNLKVTAFSDNEHLLAWEDDSARYHAFVRLPDLNVARGVIYKNPPRTDDEKAALRGYFKTRRLQANSARWSGIIAGLIKQAREEGLFDAADAAAAKVNAARATANAEAAAAERVKAAAPELLAALRDAVVFAQREGLVCSPWLSVAFELLERLEATP